MFLLVPPPALYLYFPPAIHRRKGWDFIHVLLRPATTRSADQNSYGAPIHQLAWKKERYERPETPIRLYMLVKFWAHLCRKRGLEDFAQFDRQILIPIHFQVAPDIGPQNRLLIVLDLLEGVKR